MSIEHSPSREGHSLLAYSVEEFCALSGLGRSFLYEAIRNGDLKARKAGRRTLILSAEAQRYLDTLPEVETAGEAT